MSKGFIFDMDGVITNTEPLYLAVIRKIVTDLNLAITEKELLSYVGISSEMMWQALKEKYGIEAIFFPDEAFISGKQWIQAFCDGISRSGIEWACQSRVDINDPGLFNHDLWRINCLYHVSKHVL